MSCALGSPCPGLLVDGFCALASLSSFSLELEEGRGKKNYNSKKEDLEEEDQPQDERNVIL